MKKYLLIILLAFSFILFGCGFEIGSSYDMHHKGDSSDKTSADEKIHKFDYTDTIAVTSDSDGIHFSLDLPKNLITKVEVYEISSGTEVLCAQVKPTEDKYYFLVEDSPVGDTVFKMVDGSLVPVDSSYRTNYLNGNVKLDFAFATPGKQYEFIYVLTGYIGKIKDIVNGDYYERYYHEDDEYKKYFVIEGGKWVEADNVQFFATKKVRAASSITANSILSSHYDKENDLYSRTKDNGNVSFPYSVNENGTMNFSAAATYTYTTKQDKCAFTVPCISVSDTYKGESVADLLSADPESQYGVDYALSSVTYAVSLSDYIKPCTVDQSKAIEDLSEQDKHEVTRYYTELYNHRAVSYVMASEVAPNVVQTVNVTDNRISISAEASRAGNKVKFTLPKDAQVVQVYNKINGESVLVGTMTGALKKDTAYTFTDYLAVPNAKNNYYVVYDGTGTKSANVTSNSILDYTPAVIQGVYKEDKSAQTYIYEIANPFVKLPENFTASTSLLFYSNSFNSGEVKTLFITNETTELDIAQEFAEEGKSKWRGIGHTYVTAGLPHGVLLEGTVDGIAYKNYGEIKGFSKLGSITVPDLRTEEEKARDEQNYGGNNGDDGKVYPDDYMDELERQDFHEYYDENVKPYEVKLKKGNSKDYAKFISATETSEGVELKIFVPERTNYLTVSRFKNDGSVQRGYTTFTFAADALSGGEVTLVDYSVEANSVYGYKLFGDSVQGYKYGEQGLEYYPTDTNEKITFEDGTIVSYNPYQEIYAKTTRDSPYYLSVFPSQEQELDEYTLQWNKLPEGYKSYGDYDGSLMTVYEDNQSYFLRDYDGDKEYKIHYYVKIPMPEARNYEITFETINYKCFEAKESYYEDLAGNRVDIDLTADLPKYKFTLENKAHFAWDSNVRDPENAKECCEYKFWRNTAGAWDSQDEPVAGKYKPVSVSSGLYSSMGLWIYNEANFKLTDAAILTVRLN